MRIILGASILLAGLTLNMFAITINGGVGTNGKAQISAGVVNSTAVMPLKIAFVNTGSGTNLQLCAGSNADFTAGKCAMILGVSGGAGFTSLMIIDAGQLYGKQIYVIRGAGTAASGFTVTVE
jgi:hypothetical protein